MTLKCEMCLSNRVAWHQTEPVDRYLCAECAMRDQVDTHPRRWVGLCNPDLESEELNKLRP